MAPIYLAKGHYLILLVRMKCEEPWFNTYITKKSIIFFSPSLMSYLLCTCLPLLIPQLLKNHKSRRKNHDECNTQKQFMAIFNLPFGFFESLGFILFLFSRFSLQQSEVKNIFSRKMNCVFSFFFFT